MTSALKIGSNIGFGLANQSDPFQTGREAAHAAKTEFGTGTPQWVLGLGPSNAQFQDFIEGVRLVTGEEALVGLPLSRLYFSEKPTELDWGAIALAAPEFKITMSGSESLGAAPDAAATAILTSIRSKRGSIRSQYERQGFLIFQNHSGSTAQLELEALLNEIPLDAWACAYQLSMDRPAPMVLRDQIIREGTIAIEILSRTPWGWGSVNVAAFQNNPDILIEGALTAARGAKRQLGQVEPAAGFVFIRDDHNRLEEASSLVAAASKELGGIPLVGIPCAASRVFLGSGSGPAAENEISILLTPR